ncbi:M1 family metallopeptidase [Longimicrobium sp.]|uniref:M1 family metallopeptidase n=1 Tax=Longimicrobium sp. TaxID=2029185 RepID=UPI002C6065BC|nr:M1 family metallopeptidase [Longimicrobium sp.]HSU16527.1 M1 family metallopeptidase [Longimicrobium sp.]
MKRWTPALLALLALPSVLTAQQAGAWPPARPFPNPVEVPRGFQRAVQRGTRTTTGVPGPRYWQQWANYRIHASVDPAAKTVTGGETIVYHNRSPDTLQTLNVQLILNVHRPEAQRDEENEATGGVNLTRVAARGQNLGEARQRGQAGYAVQGTNLAIRPGAPLLPGDSIRLDFEWSFRIPQAGASGRMGYDADNLVFMAYWYPQMAVYDDVNGWQTDPFLGTAEYYMGYGNYEYTIDAPAGWVVMGTGELANAAQALPAPVLARWRRAMQSDTTVHVLTAADFGAGKATAAGANGRVAWTFRADSVRDVAFSVTRESLWDAARTSVGDRNGDGRPDFVTINAFYRQSAPAWRNAVRFEQQSITHHSQFTGVKYPYPHMTAVEGENIIGGGMEYPMMTLIGAYNGRSDTTFYSVVSHELGHMWFPMVIGVDERRYGWMDEGTTDFNENEARNAFFHIAAPGAHLEEQQQYLQFVQRGIDVRELTWTDYITPPAAGGFATYPKPATLLQTLRNLIGEAAFTRGYQAYARAWAFRHPQPYDFFNAFNTAAGRDLGWFWSAWYDHAWSLDQAVQGVTAEDGGTTITIADRGNAPMPARLVITRQDGRTERREVPVEAWLAGTRTATVTLPAGGSPVVRVEIDPERAFPDADRTNNVWTR